MNLELVENAIRHENKINIQQEKEKIFIIKVDLIFHVNFKDSWKL